MLARKFRLAGGLATKNVLKRGKLVRGGPVSLRICRNGLAQNRFGFVVSRRVSKQATERNLLKRRAREIVRKKLRILKPGHDVIFIFNESAPKLAWRGLEDEFVKILKSSGL